MNDPAVLEDICFSRNVDSYFVNKYEADRDYWAKYGIDNPSMHIGLTSGAFRIFPARVSETCNAYDPRVRPWYVAGSSGPKNVVMLLDTSGSMDGIRLYYLKQAATRIIDTLTVADRVALVPFSSSAQAEYFDGRALVKVTSSIKVELKKRIDELQANGATNMHDAFSRAFQVMEESIPLELVVDCNTAILFLTDGKMTDPPEITEGEVLDFVRDGLSKLEQRLSHPVHLFAYSISENDDVHTFPKQLACGSTDFGIWSKVVDESTIVESLSSYTNLFSLGLGEGKNLDFTAWVEPYIFSTRAELGVTVSAPAFDRSVDPPVLIGVVGLDLLTRALDRALGVETGSSETYDRIVLSSTAKCPRLETSQCQLEAFRSLSIAGEDARCGLANCSSTDDIVLTSTLCANQDDAPSNVLANTDTEGLLFVERTCCTVGFDSTGSQASSFLTAEVDTCTLVTDQSDGMDVAAIVGGSVGGAAFLMMVAGAIYYFRRGRNPRNSNVPMANATPVEEAMEAPVAMAPPFKIEETGYAIPHHQVDA